VHRNCGGHIHAVFICNATLFCGVRAAHKEWRHEAKEAEENKEVRPV